MFTRWSEIFHQSGKFFLSVTLFLISFPRSWSLYPLGLFLFIGLLTWIKGFRQNYELIKKDLLLILPPVIYFILHLISLIIQSGPVTLLTDRLMFLLIPLFGLPLFIKFTKEDDLKFLRIFIAGILLVAMVLIIRIVIFVLKLVPDDMNFFQYACIHKYWFFSAHLSVFEHPTYLSMKIIWVLIILILINKKLKHTTELLFGISLFLSVFLFFLASRASIVFWIFLVIFFLVRLYRKKYLKPVFMIIMIPSIILLAVISLRINGRINDSVNELRIKIDNNEFEWKNIDQRTREWYTAVQVIKGNLLAGAGYLEIKDKMREEYLKNGFYEEARSNFNAHNQFLEAQMTFGISGTLSLLLMLLTPVFRRKFIEYQQLAITFVIMVSFFLIFESMLNRQWGIMFFLIFYFLLSRRKTIPDN